ncbi:uncharacterized protein [Ptychodera flava]|uniref:uncharacterized protein n=1 Tax=Ptychodera flava TaxID=63121 RepID=UPI00396A1168
MAIRNRGPGAANEQEEESGYSSSSTMVKSIGSDDPKDVKRRDSVSVPDNIVHAMQSLKKKDIRPFARALDIDDPDIENIFDDHRHDGNEEIKYQIALACIRRYGCEVVKFADALRKVGHGSAARELVPEVQALQETGYDGVREEQEGEHHHCKEEIYQRKYEEKGSRYSSSSRLMIKDKEKQPGYMIGNKIMITALTIILPCFVVFSRAPWLRHSSHRYSVFVGIACASIAAQMFRPKISRWFQVLYGIGGCGKTEIASSYVWNNWRRYDHVFVLNGKSNSFLDYGFKKMLENMKMDLSDAEKVHIVFD